MTDDITPIGATTPADPYATMTASQADQARAAAAEVRKLVKRATADLLQVGAILVQMKDLLDHGLFQAWAEAEFGNEFASRTARLYMRAATAIQQAQIKVASVATLPITAVAAVAAAPAEARPALLARAAEERLTVTEVRALARAAAPPPALPAPAGPDPDRTAELIAAARRSVIQALHVEIDPGIRMRVRELPVALHCLVSLIAQGQAGELAGRAHGMTDTLLHRASKYAYSIADEIRALGMTAPEFRAWHKDISNTTIFGESQRKSRPSFEKGLVWAQIDAALLVIAGANTWSGPSPEQVVAAARVIWDILYPPGARPELATATPLSADIAAWPAAKPTPKSKVKMWGVSAEEAIAQNPFGVAVEPLTALARHARAAQEAGAAPDTALIVRLGGEIAAALGIAPVPFAEAGA